MNDLLCQECKTGKLALVKSQQLYYEIRESGHPAPLSCQKSDRLGVECLSCGTTYDFEQDYNGRVVFVKRGLHRVYSGELM